MDSLVTNAASKTGVKKAVAKEKRIRDRELNDLTIVLNTAEGRRVVWRIMEECKIFNSIMSGNSWTHYNAGKQDLGHFIMSEIVDANEELLFLMMKENKKKEND